MIRKVNLELEMVENLRTIRKKLGFRQVDLALKAGCGVSMIWLIENGYANRVSGNLKRKIALALGHRVQDIFPESKAPKDFRKGLGN